MCNSLEQTERSPSEIDFYGSHNCSQLICIEMLIKKEIQVHDLWLQIFERDIYNIIFAFFSGQQHRLQS